MIRLTSQIKSTLLPLVTPHYNKWTQKYYQQLTYDISCQNFLYHLSSPKLKLLILHLYFSSGKESGTITYNNSLKYFKTTQDMSIWSLCYLLQRRMLKERCIRKKHVDMSRLKGLRYGLLYVSIITYPQLDICIHNYISIITNPFVYSVQCTVNAKKTLTTTNSYV